MLRSAFFLLLAYSVVNSANGMDCSFGQSSNFIQEYANKCPNILNPNLNYCCPDFDKQTFYCCDAEEFAIKTGLGIIVPAVIAVVVVVMFIIFCISCLCCSCCPWYKRRHRGTVYGKVQGPSVIQVIQTPGNMQVPPTQVSHSPYAYPASQAMPNYGQPPQYTAEAYGKQAAYNPNYGQ